MPFYQSNDTKTYSTAPGTPISVIAAFNTEGGIKPLRIRIDGLNDHIEANIDKVLSSRKLYGTEFIFQCLVTIEDAQRQIKLNYSLTTNLWKLE